MFVHFTFRDHSNPYIATANKALFWMICHYDLEQTGCTYFHVIGEKQRPITYAEKKETVRDFAIEWQGDWGNRDYSYGELAMWQDFFEEYGRKYGLREFKENAIL